MDFESARRKSNVAVRQGLQALPGTLGTIAYLWACACTMQAYFDRSPSTTTRMRIQWVCRNLAFLRWWRQWLLTMNLPLHLHFISGETFAALIMADHAMILLVLLFAERFPDKPFAPWLFGSDQCEHFFSEMRSYCINQPNWTMDELVPLIQRFVHEHEMLSRPNVHLPNVRSTKGYARSNYVPAQEPSSHVPSERHTCDDVRAAYTAAVEEVRGIFIVLGCAEDLREDSAWHEPPLEVWSAIEKAVQEEQQSAGEVQEQLARQTREHERAASSAAGIDDSSDDEEQMPTGEAGSSEEGGGQGADEPIQAEVVEEEEEAENFPEKIVGHKFLRTGRRRAEDRYLLVKWQGYSSRLDLTWESQRNLLEDGHRALVRPYLLSNNLVLPAELRVDADAESDGDEEMEGGEESATPQPPIGHANLAAVLDLITAPIGSEQPNVAIPSYKLAATGTAKQIARYERCHITNPETGQVMHKASALAHLQKQVRDAKPGAGRDRYVTGVRQPIVSEDSSGTGFEYDKCYQLYTDERGVALNSHGNLFLDGCMQVCERAHESISTSSSLTQ